MKTHKQPYSENNSVGYYGITGRIVEVLGSIVTVSFKPSEQKSEYDIAVKISIIPKIHEALWTELHDKKLLLEVQKNVGNYSVLCVALGTTDGLSRGMTVYRTGGPLYVPVGETLHGRILNVLGEPIDSKGEINAPHKKSIHQLGPLLKEQKKTLTVLETGIKAIDLLIPFPLGGKIGIFGGAGVGKTTLLGELFLKFSKSYNGEIIFVGIGERTREGAELWRIAQSVKEFREKLVMILGQMNEPPGCRWRVGFTAATIAEYFRDELKRDVFLGLDNLFRFIQAGSEVSAILGNIPSAVGYQPQLSNEISQIEERLTSTNNGSITSIQAIYAPADDYSDPALAAAFPHFDAIMTLDRSIFEKGLNPSIDFLNSTSRLLSPMIVGERHAEVAARIRKLLQKYHDLRDVIAIIGLDNFRDINEDDAIQFMRARKVEAFLTQPFFITHGPNVGRSVKLADTISGFEAILNGECDDWPDDSFRNKGELDEVEVQARKLAAIA